MELLNSQQLRRLGEVTEQFPKLWDMLEEAFQLLAGEERDRCVGATLVGQAQRAAVHAGKTEALENAVGELRELVQKSLDELHVPVQVEGESGN